MEARRSYGNFFVDDNRISITMAEVPDETGVTLVKRLNVQDTTNLLSKRRPAEPISLEDIGLMWGDTGSSISRCNKTLLERLEIFYTFRKRDKILDFLGENCFLLSLLFEIYAELPKYFAYTPIVLDVVDDPEVEGYSQMEVTVLTHLDPSEAIEQLDRFDEDWWLNAMIRSKGKICINLEFK